MNNKEQTKNILISTLGATPDIIEETIGIFNYRKDIDFYKGNKRVETMRENLCFIDEVWLVATDQLHKEIPNRLPILNAEESYEYICEHCKAYGTTIRMFVLDGIADITNEVDAKAFHDLLLRVVAFAHQSRSEGKLYLSLACGRKTMSSDMQDAAYIFGCNQLLHVLGENKENAEPVLMGNVTRNEAIKPQHVDFPSENFLRCPPQSVFLTDIEQQKQQSQHFYTSYYLKEQETRSNFHVLYTLPPSRIEQLKNDHIGVCPDVQNEELAWLRQLPKTDLHCHLGGVLNLKEIVDVAIGLGDVIKKFAEQNPNYAAWLNDIDYSTSLDYITPKWKNIVKEIAEKYSMPKSCVATPILQQFKGKEDELTKRWYGENLETSFCEVGIEKYERLGDLQGSSLLDHPHSLELTMNLLLNRCINENVKYLEIRCSPFNYARNDFSVEDVILLICHLMDSVCDKLETSLIFIISRHRGDSTSDYVELVKRMKDNPLFKKFFRGFDLAGNESIKTPKELRNSFMDIMKECYNITIHAGETEEVESIWQAVYHLNAERIGHGLHLLQKKDLLNKFLERGIGVELCPSSNYQIVGFRDNYFPKETGSLPEYPLKAYLDKELKVSVNTDDPGISLTDMTHELHKAARMTSGGLSKWEILQMICNGFRSAFYPYEQKKQLIRKAEEDLAVLIKNGKL
jgi:adenosine deaminase